MGLAPVCLLLAPGEEARGPDGMGAAPVPESSRQKPGHFFTKNTIL